LESSGTCSPFQVKPGEQVKAKSPEKFGAFLLCGDERI
jgi:hypothetical protein